MSHVKEIKLRESDTFNTEMIEKLYIQIKILIASVRI